MARILIVEARFYEHLNDLLLAGARAAIAAAGHGHETITVPGALEVPGAIAFASESGRYDAYVGIGVVIRGETYHFEIVSNEMASAVARVALETGIPVANGVLTTENDEQAQSRATEKGRDCARAAVEMANLIAYLEPEEDDEDDEDEDEDFDDQQDQPRR